MTAQECTEEKPLRLVGRHQSEAAQSTDRAVFQVSQQPAGLLLLRVSHELKSVTLKVLKQEGALN